MYIDNGFLEMPLILKIKIKQEVQIILTLEVYAEKSKEDIKRFFYGMEQNYTQTVSNRNRWEFSKIAIIEIKEETEIYNSEQV